MIATSADGVLAEIHRAEWGRLLASLVARTRRLDLVEDALSEAFARAAARWPTDGVPDRPAAWLYTTAYRQVLGRLRGEAMAGRKAPLLATGLGWEPPPAEPDALGDERLDLILLCCHPALQPESRSALALRLVIGTPTEEIARLFLVKTATMAARLTRAKKKIVQAGIPLSAPVGEELDRRLDEVCRTIYLAFTAGYTPGSGNDLLRADVAGEAVRLAWTLYHLVPRSPQARNLAGLLALQHARRDARVSAGRLVTLADQDRARWRHDEIAAAIATLDAKATASADGYAEELRLQARIAAAHATASVAADTDWGHIAECYERLELVTGSPVVRLNRAVAVAESAGPDAGLRLLDGLDDALPTSHRLPAVRAELARRSGDAERARAELDTAISRCANSVEVAHLEERRRSLDAPHESG